MAAASTARARCPAGYRDGADARDPPSSAWAAPIAAPETLEVPSENRSEAQCPLAPLPIPLASPHPRTVSNRFGRRKSERRSEMPSESREEAELRVEWSGTMEDVLFEKWRVGSE
jgi:hypothetical protein